MPANKPLVLVADDEQNAVVLLRHVLERDGFLVESAKDGLEALEKAHTLHPDLILMDVQMPRLNGFEVTARLREDPETARIPVIFVTAAAREPSDVAHGFNLGADDYIRKPYDYHELLARATSKMRARQLEDRIQRRSEELEALVRIGAELNRRLGLNELTELILVIARDELQADHSALYLFGEQRNLILYRDSIHGFDAPFDVTPLLSEPGTVAGRVFAENSPILINDVGAECSAHESLIRLGYHAALAAPLRHDGQLVGILTVAHTENEHFSWSSLRMLRSIGEQAALAVRNAQLHEALQSYAQNLEEMVDERTRELRSTQAQLIQSEKLAALGRLAAGIAHEVNNPLQPILNCLEVALEDIESEQPVDPESLRIAESEVQRIKGIVSRLLDFSRPSTGETSSVNLYALIEEVMILVRRQLERAHVRVDLKISPTPPIQGTATQLKQVFLNLLLNAMESMPKGGTITVESYERDAGVVIEISDTGVGMDAETLARIFEPFYSTKGEGTGLGLAVTYGIVRGHGGDIQVTSSPSAGSCFTVWLPYQRPPTAAPQC